MDEKQKERYGKSALMLVRHFFSPEMNYPGNSFADVRRKLREQASAIGILYQEFEEMVKQ